MLLVLSNCIVQTYAEDTELQDLLRKLYGRESFAKNRYILGLDYGLVYFEDAGPYNIQEGWNTEIRYGFDRYYPTKDIDMIYYRQEMLVLGNVSGRFGAFQMEGDITNELWYGKIAIKDGYGYDTEYGRLTLNHAVSLGWGANDYEDEPSDFKLIGLDETIKPLSAYNSSLRIEWDNGISLFGTIGERQFYDGTNFFNRTASIALEGTFYLIPDLAEDTLIDIFGAWYPWVHRSYNSTVSFLFYYLRSKYSADWPFNTGMATTSVILRLGFDYRIE